MTLVALIALSAGAWAETVTWVTADLSGTGNAELTKDGVTVTPDNSNGNAKSGYNFYSLGKNTFTTTLGNFTKIEIVFQPEESPVSIDGWTYEEISKFQPDPSGFPNWWEYAGKLTWEGNAESVSIQGQLPTILSITFTIADAASNAVPITWDEDTKTATIASMPAGNVEVNVNYFAQAELAMSTDATPVALAPAAIDGVKATTDEDIITAGTVADIANTTTKQGTLMYYVSEEQLDDAQLVALADQGKFSADVPKATDLTQGDVYVYYYIQGAEPTEGDRTDANTCSDSDIKATNFVQVTIGEAPLWNAELDLTDAPEEDKAPGVWTTDIPKGGVVKSTEVTVTYTGTKKVIGVKAEKKAPFAANEYNEASWDDTKVVLTKKTAASEPTAVADAPGSVTWSDGWYTVSGNVTITGTVTLGADTHLILQDGAQLTINGQLKCNSDNGYSLYIYGQEAGNGKLNVSNNDIAIFGSTVSGKTIEIHGGEITAESTSAFGFYSYGIKLYGGKLTATANAAYAAGIMFDSGNFDVYGGEVEAKSNASLGGLGIAINSDTSILTVYGGKVKATGGTGSESKAIYAKVKSGTTGIKFYFTDTEGDWGVGTTYSTETTAPTNRYAKAE